MSLLDPLLTAALGLLVMAGLWTPIVGTLASILALSHGATGATDPWRAVLLGTIGVALALLGPGAWSVDARLFGWKQIEIPNRKPPAPPPI